MAVGSIKESNFAFMDKRAELEDTGIFIANIVLDVVTKSQVYSIRICNEIYQDVTLKYQGIIDLRLNIHECAICFSSKLLC